MASLISWLFGAPIEETQPEEHKFDRLAVLDEIAADQAANGSASVSQDTALKLSTVYACARVIAEGMAQVPCKVHKTTEDGRKVEAREHKLFNLLHRSPNDWQTSFEFREQIAWHLVLRGNAFVFVNRNARGEPLELYAFEPGKVTVTRHSDYSLSYEIEVSEGKKQKLPAQNIWHLRGPSWNGWQGMDLLDKAASAIGLGKATEVYGQKFFENGARPGGVLSTEQQLTKEQYDNLVERWKSQQAGQANAHKTAILTGGLSYSPIQSTANEAQWTEARRHQINEVCRFFRVQPVMIQANENATSYNSIEQLFLSHLTHTLMPWFERFEQSAWQTLLTPKDKKAGYYIKLHERAMLRASTAERTAYYNAGRTQGWLTANEIREKEDLPRSDDPKANELSPAANLFGSQEPSTDDEVSENDD